MRIRRLLWLQRGRAGSICQFTKWNQEHLQLYILSEVYTLLKTSRLYDDIHDLLSWSVLLLVLAPWPTIMKFWKMFNAWKYSTPCFQTNLTHTHPMFRTLVLVASCTDLSRAVSFFFSSDAMNSSGQKLGRWTSLSVSFFYCFVMPTTQSVSCCLGTTALR